eukprot:352421-Chlamydomonas_euryale.AAC.83
MGVLYVCMSNIIDNRRDSCLYIRDANGPHQQATGHSPLQSSTRMAGLRSLGTDKKEKPLSAQLLYVLGRPWNCTLSRYGIIDRGLVFSFRLHRWERNHLDSPEVLYESCFCAGQDTQPLLTGHNLTSCA